MFHMIIFIHALVQTIYFNKPITITHLYNIFNSNKNVLLENISELHENIWKVAQETESLTKLISL